MSMSNNIGGPNFNNPGLSRLPSSASGNPAAETGAQFHTTDGVTLGGGQLAPSGKDTRGPSAEITLRQQPAPSGGNGPSVNNNPTILTVGDMHHSHACEFPDIMPFGPSNPTHLETLGTGGGCPPVVRAGTKPFEN